jgi:hypothetical protein
VATAPTRPTPRAADPISEFFTDLAQLGHLATFESEFAALRFDVRNGTSVERWHVTVRDGQVAVSRRGGPADAVGSDFADLLEVKHASRKKGRSGSTTSGTRTPAASCTRCGAER